MIRCLGFLVATVAAFAQPVGSDPAGVLSQFAVARFVGSGPVAIQAMTTDAAGNIYVAAAATAPDLPTVNAAQVSGESLVMRSLDAGLTWQKLPSPATAFLTIRADPTDAKTLFAGADGIYKSVDGGQSWRPVYSSASAGVGAIAIDPAVNSKYVYAYDEFNLRFLASSDRGESWSDSVGPRPAGLTPPYGPARLWVDPSGSGAVVMGLWRSTDHGATWTSMTTPPRGQVFFTTPDTHHPGWIYAVGNDGSSFPNSLLSLSKDSGATWIPRPSPTGPGVALDQLIVDPDMPDTLYAAAHLGGLFVSVDDAATWQGMKGSPSGYYAGPVFGLALSRQCPGGGLVVADGFGTVFPSPGFGTWQPATLSMATDMAIGAGCALYAVRSQLFPDAFVAKIAPDGKNILWSTYLGGSGVDTPAAIAIDSEGNVIVAGSTSSPDFPVTVPRSGSYGDQSGFVAKFDSDGRVVYSLVLGGESGTMVSGLTLDSQGAAYVSGNTNPFSFPSDAFAMKFSPDGAMNYATYLPGYANVPFTEERGVHVAAESSGSILLGYSDNLYRLTPDGSSASIVASLPGLISNIAIGPHGNIFVSGEVQSGNTGSTVCLARTIEQFPRSVGDIFVTKLHANTLEPIYSARLYGHCESRPNALVVDAKGEVTIGAITYGDFPMLNPTLSVSPNAWFNGAAVVSRLSADGQELLYSSYLDTAQLAAFAVGPDGSIYAGVTGPSAVSGPILNASQSAALLQLPPVHTLRKMSIRIAANAFDPTGSMAPGALLSITGQNFTNLSVDLGLNYTDILPTELAGVQVLFDGVPAQLIRAAPDQIICVVPMQLTLPGRTTVQVVSSFGQTSNPVVVPIVSGGPGVLSQAYPNPPIGPVDGIILNADGSQNSSTNPAAAGSSVTLFCTGVAGPGNVPIYFGATEDSPLNPLILMGTATPAPGVPEVYTITFSPPSFLGKRVIVGGIGSNVTIYVK